MAVIEWITHHEVLLGYLGLLSLVTFVLTLMLVPVLVVRMPADYFVYDKEDLKQYRRQHPLARLVILTMKNIIGALFICAGLAMLVLPGQGLITILIGITLISFPRKRALECWIIRQTAVARTINWIRAKAGTCPVVLPPCPGDGLDTEQAACKKNNSHRQKVASSGEHP